MRPNIPTYRRPADQEQWVFNRGFNHGYIGMNLETRPYTLDTLNIAYQAGWQEGLVLRQAEKEEK